MSASTHNEEVEVLGDGGSQTLRLEDTQNLVSSHEADLGDTLRVTQLHADLRRCEASTCKLDDLLDYLFRRSLEPRRRRTLVRERAGGDPLPLVGVNSCPARIGTMRQKPSASVMVTMTM